MKIKADLIDELEDVILKKKNNQVKLEVLKYFDNPNVYFNIEINVDQIISIEKTKKLHKWSLVGKSYVATVYYKLEILPFKVQNINKENSLELFEFFDKKNENFKSIYITEKSYSILIRNFILKRN